MTKRRPRLTEAEPDLSLPVTDVAEQWLQDCVRERLAALDVSASDLASRTGWSASNWRNKLNGTRPLQVADLLAIAMSVDSDLFERPPFDSRDLSGYFPPSYRGHLSHSGFGVRVPTFEGPGTAWASVMTATNTWIREENAAGRGWLIDATGLAHHVVQLAADQGLPSTTATLAGRTDTRLDIEWIAHDLLVCVATLGQVTAGRPTSEEVRDAHGAFTDVLVEMGNLSGGQKVLTALTSPAALAVLGHVLRVADLDPGQWQVVTLGQLHQLAPAEHWTETPSDFHVRVERYEPEVGLLSLWVK
jgi:hypothetical protein